MKTKHCQWCDHTFETEINYQIYCSSECRDLATREKISQRYIAKRRSKRLGQTRVCKSCGSNLSIYNDDDICLACDVNPKDVSKALKDIRRFISGRSNKDK